MDVGVPAFWPPGFSRINGKSWCEFTVRYINMDPISQLVDFFHILFKLVGRFGKNGRSNHCTHQANSSICALRRLKRAASPNGVFSQVSIIPFQAASSFSSTRDGRQRTLLSLSWRVILASYA